MSKVGVRVTCRGYRTDNSLDPCRFWSYVLMNGGTPPYIKAEETSANRMHTAERVTKKISPSVLSVSPPPQAFLVFGFCLHLNSSYA